MEALAETLLGPRSDLDEDIGNEYYIELTLDVVTEIKVSSKSLTKSVQLKLKKLTTKIHFQLLSVFNKVRNFLRFKISKAYNLRLIIGIISLFIFQTDYTVLYEEPQRNSVVYYNPPIYHGFMMPLKMTNHRFSNFPSNERRTKYLFAKPFQNSSMMSKGSVKEGRVKSKKFYTRGKPLRLAPAPA